MNKEKEAKLILDNLLIRIDKISNIKDLEKLINMFIEVYKLLGDSNENKNS